MLWQCTQFASISQSFRKDSRQAFRKPMHNTEQIRLHSPLDAVFCLNECCLYLYAAGIDSCALVFGILSFKYVESERYYKMIFAYLHDVLI